MGDIKFNDYVKLFPHHLFGNLTVIKSKKEEDTYWFVGKEIQNLLGFKNLNQVISDADLDDDEVMILEKKNNNQLFDDFIKHYQNKVYPLNGQASEDPIFSKYSPSITLIKESGLYGLAMVSRKPIAKDFKRAIRKDILPAVRKLFEVKNKVSLKHNVELHFSIDVQKEYSKLFNRIRFLEGGVKKVVSDNIEMSMKHTGLPPIYWKNAGIEEAEKRGIPVSKIASGLDGMRLLAPEKSCAISLNKNYQERGISSEEAFSLTCNPKVYDFFSYLIESGIIPYEFYNKKIK
jgi:prophage antirepressor-like protein